jgi:hypothetical protein
MVGCGGGGSGGDSSSSNGGGTDNPNNGNTNPKPVTCAETQYLEEGYVKTRRAEYSVIPLSNLIQGQSYPLSLQTDQGLAVTFSSNTPNICSVSGSELKALKLVSVLWH